MCDPLAPVFKLIDWVEKWWEARQQEKLTQRLVTVSAFWKPIGVYGQLTLTTRIQTGVNILYVRGHYQGETSVFAGGYTYSKTKTAFSYQAIYSGTGEEQTLFTLKGEDAQLVKQQQLRVDVFVSFEYESQRGKKYNKTCRAVLKKGSSNFEYSYK